MGNVSKIKWNDNWVLKNLMKENKFYAKLLQMNIINDYDGTLTEFIHPKQTLNKPVIWMSHFVNISYEVYL